MKSIRISVVLASAMALAGSSAMFAHHSQSQFEPELTISIEGTLTKASWSNPHTPQQVFLTFGGQHGWSG